VTILQEYFDQHVEDYPGKVTVKLVYNTDKPGIKGIKATYINPAETKENTTAKQITISFPFTTLGDFHGYGYD
jgi:hypothetical protein